MNQISMEVAKPYNRLYQTTKHRIIMYSPRLSGKSKAVVQLLFFTCLKHPGKDMLVARANYNALDDSLFNEILDIQEELGLSGFFLPKKNPLRMTTIMGNTIMFKGIGGADLSRTRGLKTVRKREVGDTHNGGNLALVFIDEAQQLKNELNLKHAIASLMRNLDTTIDDAKIIIAGNPHEVKGHWWNTYCKKMRNAPNYEFIDATYMDIKKYLSKDVLDEIETERVMNPAQYKFMYLGSLDELQGGAYGQFKQEKHFITEQEATALFPGERIWYVIFGTDGAITHDSTCICPVAILSSGRALVLERFFYDPMASGQILSTVQLVELIKQYLDELEKKYQFTKQYCEKIFAVDCASADLIAQLRYELDDSYIIKSFTDKRIIQNNNVVNDAFAKNVLFIKNTNGQRLYHNNLTMPNDPLIDQLESVVWKDYKLDPQIPNDCTDALTYGVNYYFLNPDNMAFPERQKKYEKNGTNI